LLAPTVILNGAYWGQCDITYTSSLLGFLYFLLVQQFSLALIAFTLALAFKLQAIFLAPLLAILLIRGVMPGSRLVLIPVTYGLTLLPAHLVGRPWSELLTIYHQQFNTYRSLTLNAPTLYQWLPDRPYTTFVILGLSWTALLTLGLLIFTYKKIKAFTPELIITLALLSSILLPFFLPKMHDRYFFGADVISIIFAFYQPKYWWISPAILAISLASYAPYLLQQEIIPLKFLALGLALILWQLFRVLAQTIDEQHVTDQTLPSA
jgi:Gpi18-like mannosyltransferase